MSLLLSEESEVCLPKVIIRAQGSFGTFGYQWPMVGWQLATIADCNVKGKNECEMKRCEMTQSTIKFVEHLQLFLSCRGSTNAKKATFHWRIGCWLLSCWLLLVVAG
jgi:hypothetical protein